MTLRQEEILIKILKEYIESARPVSSLFLEKKYHLNLSPATIRNEMKALIEMGYLSQPHTSSGRVPTSKAYRFLVDNLLLEEREEVQSSFKGSFNERLKIVNELIKEISFNSSVLAFAYFKDNDLFLVEGWSTLLKNPEFEERNFLNEFIIEFEALEEEIRERIEEIDDFEISIGKEKNISSDKISLIISKNLPGTCIGILGPARMKYAQNINLILKHERRNKKRN